MMYGQPNIKYTNILPAYTTYEDGTHSVPKCRHIKFRRQGITQKKEYIIQNMAKILKSRICTNDEANSHFSQCCEPA
jgi:hypothetical protein